MQSVSDKIIIGDRQPAIVDAAVVGQLNFEPVKYSTGREAEYTIGW